MTRVPSLGLHLADQEAASTPVRVLLVEDQALFRDALAEGLKGEAGMQVVGEAADGEEAVRQALELRPDVVLMDIGLPKVDGLEATRRLKARVPGLKVIALTAHSGGEMFRRALSVGVDSFVLKDSRLSELVAAIKLTSAGHRLMNGQLLEDYLGRAKRDLPFGLTPRELQLLRAIAAGQSNRAIAEKLGIGEKTVRNHLFHIYGKLSVTSRSQAAMVAVRIGLFSPDSMGANGTDGT